MSHEFDDAEMMPCDCCGEFWPGDEMTELEDGQPVSVKQIWYAVKTHSETFCFAEGRIMLLIQELEIPWRLHVCSRAHNNNRCRKDRSAPGVCLLLVEEG